MRGLLHESELFLAVTYPMLETHPFTISDKEKVVVNPEMFAIRREGSNDIAKR